jgi:hypothetical protein
MKTAKPSDILIDLCISVIITLFIIGVITLNTGCGSTRKTLVKTETRTDSTVTETTKPDSVIAPPDSVAMFLRWSELCDSAWRSRMILSDTIISTSKEAIWDSLNHRVTRTLTGTLKVTQDGLKFVCREDSLKAIIDSLVKVKTTSTVVYNQYEQVAAKNKWSPMWIVSLLFSLALLIFALYKLLK